MRVSRGAPLDAAARNALGPQVGDDLDDVAVHTDAPAVIAARAIGASAFTFGSDVYLDSDAARRSTQGEVLAHELTHVAQQRGRTPWVQRTVRSALELIVDRRFAILDIATKWGVDPFLVARVIFQENRNDNNIVRDDDDSWWNVTGISGPWIKNAITEFLVPFGRDGSLGITEMTISTARQLLETYMPEREFKFEQRTRETSYAYDTPIYVMQEVTVTVDEMTDWQLAEVIKDETWAIELATLYLKQLGEDPLNAEQPISRELSPETLLEDYNRGISGHKAGVQSEVGQRSGPYVDLIIQALVEGSVPDDLEMREDWVRPRIQVQNDTEQAQRVYLKFHAKIDGESSWFNTNYAMAWTVQAGDKVELMWNDAPVESDMVSWLYETLSPTGESQSFSSPRVDYPGFVPPSQDTHVLTIP